MVVLALFGILKSQFCKLYYASVDQNSCDDIISCLFMGENLKVLNVSLFNNTFLHSSLCLLHEQSLYFILKLRDLTEELQ